MSKSKTVDTIQAALTQPGTAHTVLLTTLTWVMFVVWLRMFTCCAAGTNRTGRAGS